MHIVPIAAVDPAAVERVLDRAFGADRHGRTAYRLRAGCTALPALSRAAFDGAELVATLQCWPVAFRPDHGDCSAMTLVGPVAVLPERQRDGLGRALMTGLLAAVPPALPMMLIGDPDYYERLFGFSAARTTLWRLPGPFEPHRLLARGNVPDAAGLVVAGTPGLADPG